jgi:hypothetical protein
VAGNCVYTRSLLAILGVSLTGLMPLTVANAASPESQVQNGMSDENHMQIANRPSWHGPIDAFRAPKSLAGTKIAPFE